MKAMQDELEDRTDQADQENQEDQEDQADKADALSRILVLQAGSATFRFGYAKHEKPMSMPNVVAYRRSKAEDDADRRRRRRRPHTAFSDDQLRRIEQTRLEDFHKRVGAFRDRYKRRYQKPTSNSFFSQVNTQVVYDESNAVRQLSDEELEKAKCEVPELQLDESTRMLIGEDVLHLPEYSEFEPFWPITRGQFTSNPFATLLKVCDALEHIIRFAVSTKLGIPQADVSQYSVVLIVSDDMCRREIAELHSILLKRIGFFRCSVHKEPVLACFGAGVSTACVVDIGREKTSICCVREGMVMPETRRMLRYGGDDITRTLAFLLEATSAAGEHHFPLKIATHEDDCNDDDVHVLQLENLQHFAALQRLKVALCEFPPSAVDDARFGKSADFVIRRHDHAYRYGVNATMASFFAPQALFFTSLLPACCYDGFAEVHPLNFIERDVQAMDYLDKAFLDDAPMLQGRVKDKKVDKGTSGTTPVKGGGDGAAAEDSPEPLLCRRTYVYGDDDDDDDDRAQPQDDDQRDARPCPPTPLPVVVADVLAAVDDVELRRSLATQVLLVGASAHFAAIVDEMEQQLLESASALLREHDKVEVISAEKLMVDAADMSWKGGAIISDNDCLKSCWISSSEWCEAGLGVHLLRARVPFPWD